MSVERTLSIIKPDAVAKNVIGQIYARFEGAGLKIAAAKMAHLSRGEAEAFYAVHRARPFFKDLVEFMISGPVMIQVLEGEGAIAKNRELMGATDPKKAEKGTIRADFADSIDANAVHKARPFFKDLVDFMISGPVMIQALEGENAIAKNRELMGATDPKKAEKGTIRADFADSIDANAVHGSDAPETAALEVAFFFPGMNVYSR
jgi:nucleoside-diphosphate kinase